MVVDVAAAPEALWNAISTGPGIETWFAPTAKVLPGLGGSIWLSWGPGMEDEAPISLSEEGRAFGWTEKSGKRVDWSVEATAKGSRLRMLQVQATAGKKKAWRTFYSALRFGLERHPGQPAGTRFERILSLDAAGLE